MSLSISSRIVAEVQIQNATLRPVLGGFELVFGVYAVVPAEREEPREAWIRRARVTVQTLAGQPQPLGFAHPELDFYIVTGPHSSSTAAALVLQLQSGQVAAIERMRGPNDLTFTLAATGTGTTEYGPQRIHAEWRHRVPRSDWLKALKDAGARDILLLEVPLPLPNRSRKAANITNSLQRAEENFRNGDYHACIASCRTAIQDLGHEKFKTSNWANPLLKRLASDKEGMNKNEREGALWGALRHYTHQAHHSSSEGGVGDYSRADAQLILSLTASFVAHCRTA